MSGDCETCPGKVQRWYHGTQRKGRKNIPAIVYLDEYNECNCSCHKPKPAKPVRKRN